MKKDTSSKAMTFNQMLKDPSLEPWHEALRIIKNKPSKDIFPKKYEMGIIDVAMETMAELLDKNPNLSFKKALTGAIKNLPRDITDALFSKVLQKAIEEWAELSASAQLNNQILTPVYAQEEDLVMA